jgi:SpoVK/Ycf46/Vps4 family AAA+-type ATPase
VAPPTAAQRAAILRHHSRSMPLADDVRLDALAEACHGYTGADLAALCREAALRAMAGAATVRLPHSGNVTSLQRNQQVFLAKLGLLLAHTENYNQKSKRVYRANAFRRMRQRWRRRG